MCRRKRPVARRTVTTFLRAPTVRLDNRGRTSVRGVLARHCLTSFVRRPCSICCSCQHANCPILPVGPTAGHGAVGSELPVH